MRVLDLTLPTAPENLALDEALLQEAEAGTGDEVLRFWMAPKPFVVVGLGAKVSREVKPAACRSRGIPLTRRCSGGGTVVQGPGCLNYALVLKIPQSGPLASIRGTNQFIMSRHAQAITRLVHREVRVEGHTDLALEGVKFSGNAQRRLRRHLLFHGTFLLHFDLDLISRLLASPPLQPAYRRNRSHADFLMNLGIPAEQVRSTLCAAWNATPSIGIVPCQRVATLVREKYSQREWTFRNESELSL